MESFSDDSDTLGMDEDAKSSGVLLQQQLLMSDAAPGEGVGRMMQAESNENRNPLLPPSGKCVPELPERRRRSSFCRTEPQTSVCVLSSPSPPPRKRRSESKDGLVAKDDIDLSRLDALQRHAWFANAAAAGVTTTSRLAFNLKGDNGLQNMLCDLVNRLKLLNEENFALKRDLQRSKEREKHYRQVEELALRQKLKETEESCRASLYEKRQVIRRLNSSFSQLTDKLSQRERALSQVRREVSSLEKHWTQSRLDCEILQGKLKALAAEQQVCKSKADENVLVSALVRAMDACNELTIAKLEGLVAHALVSNGKKAAPGVLEEANICGLDLREVSSEPELKLNVEPSRVVSPKQVMLVGCQSRQRDKEEAADLARAVDELRRELADSLWLTSTVSTGHVEQLGVEKRRSEPVDKEELERLRRDIADIQADTSDEETLVNTMLKQDVTCQLGRISQYVQDGLGVGDSSMKNKKKKEDEEKEETSLLLTKTPLCFGIPMPSASEPESGSESKSSGCTGIQHCCRTPSTDMSYCPPRNSPLVKSAHLVLDYASVSSNNKINNSRPCHRGLDELSE
ncbi:unnamed protein product [Notodromas monacha]|uniref:Uncharacterized protein n=1 Tax=Notodromas monacha TaxID=399045 RepID=A0A7R9BZL2_9CRUS|nr:unnamed protein product [Notodromas monacha]CAG0923405.1 unnamed protein product [Notodromas monacha]